jgi:hypothetical protein
MAGGGPVRPLQPTRATRDPGTVLSSTSTFSGDKTAPFFNFLNAVAALVFSRKHPSDLPPSPVGSIHPFLTPLTLSL